MSKTAIDLDLIRSEVAAGEPGKENLYHDFDYLNTNTNISALKALKERLDNLQPSDNNAGLRQEFEADLYKVLEQWAYRDSKTLRAGREEVVDGKEVYYPHEYTGSLAISRKYNAVTDSKTKREFVDYCADYISQHGQDPWNHNQVEKVVAIALRELMNGKAAEEVKGAFYDAMKSYTKACSDQCSKDILRDGVVLDLGGQPAVIFDSKDLTTENFPELTGEQLGFIKTLYDQGKFIGSVSTIVSNKLVGDSNEPDMLAPIGDKVSICIKKGEDGKIYALSTSQYCKMNNVMLAENNATDIPKDKLTNITIITDLTALREGSFFPGCASELPTTRILMTGDIKERDSFAIPQSIQTLSTKLDEDLEKSVMNLIPLKAAYIAHIKGECTDTQAALVKASTREMDKRLIAAKSIQYGLDIDKFHKKQSLALNDKSKTPEEAENEKVVFYTEKTTEVITDYLLKKLSPNTKVGSELQGQMKEDITALLGAIPMTSAQRKDAKNVTTLLVRNCVQIASKEDPTIKLPFGQRIRHAVIDSLKSFFSLNKEQKQLKDIVGKDFANKLKEHLNHGTAPTPPTPRGGITKRGSGIEV